MASFQRIDIDRAASGVRDADFAVRSGRDRPMSGTEFEALLQALHRPGQRPRSARRPWSAPCGSGRAACQAERTGRLLGAPAARRPRAQAAGGSRRRAGDVVFSPSRGIRLAGEDCHGSLAAEPGGAPAAHPQPSLFAPAKAVFDRDGAARCRCSRQPPSHRCEWTSAGMRSRVPPAPHTGRTPFAAAILQFRERHFPRRKAGSELSDSIIPLRAVSAGKPVRPRLSRRAH